MLNSSVHTAVRVLVVLALVLTPSATTRPDPAVAAAAPATPLVLSPADASDGPGLVIAPEPVSQILEQPKPPATADVPLGASDEDHAVSGEIRAGTHRARHGDGVTVSVTLRAALPTPAFTVSPPLPVGLDPVDLGAATFITDARSVVWPVPSLSGERAFGFTATWGSSSARLNLGFWYDLAGNITNLDDRRGDGTGDPVTFAYAPLDRLVSAGSPINESYSYDAIGNITAKTGVTGTYVYSSARPHAVETIGPTQMFWYNANGLMVTRDEGTPTGQTQPARFEQGYDKEHRLIRVWNRNTGQLTNYFYDADGALVLQQSQALPIVFDNFAALDASKWSYSAAQTITVNNPGNQRDFVKNTGGDFYRSSYAISNSVRAIFDFRTDNIDSGAAFAIESADGGYHKWGVVVTSGKLQAQSTLTGSAQPNVDLLAQVITNTWYRVTLIDNDAPATGFRVNVIDIANPAVFATLTRTMPAGKSWRFHTWVITGSASMDTYAEMKGPNDNLWIAGAHEKRAFTTTTTTNYYAFTPASARVTGQRVAMRVNSGAPVWLAGDHLGSASVALDWQGNAVSTERYMPFGATRSGSMPTDLQFTGQRRQAETAVGQMYHFGARFMLPAIGRFVSADSVVPGAGNPQALNRYSYALNKPLLLVDSSGHWPTAPADAFRAFLYGLQWTANYAEEQGQVFGELGIRGNLSQYYQANPSALSVDTSEFSTDPRFFGEVAQTKLLTGGKLVNAEAGASAQVQMEFAILSTPNVVAIAASAINLFAGIGTLSPYDCSFSANTLVETNVGLQPIAFVTTGTLVLAWTTSRERPRSPRPTTWTIQVRVRPAKAVPPHRVPIGDPCQ